MGNLVFGRNDTGLVIETIDENGAGTPVATATTPYLGVSIPGGPGPDTFQLTGAVVGRKVKSAICITLTNPNFGPVESAFEGTISINNSIVQTNTADFTDATLIFLIEGPNPDENP